MALETTLGSSLELTAQTGTAQEGQVHPFSPAILTRYQEPEGSNGSIYDIEILAHVTGSSVADDFYRVAACTLVIGAPFGKNKGKRVVDGKIENLWLKDEETANRLDNIRLLATLLSYVQDFCASAQGVHHLSSIQKADHPAWLKDFFAVAGFDRCGCLKPEAGGQCHRVCIQLDVTGATTDKKVTEGPSEISLPKVESSVPAINGTSKASKADQDAPSNTFLNETNPSEAFQSSLQKPLSSDQALEWLTQNKEILSQVTATGAANLSVPSKTKPQEINKLITETSAEMNPTEKAERPANGKRKRDSTTISQDGEIPERRARTQTDVDKQSEKLQAKKTLRDEEHQPKAKPSPKVSQLPPARNSSTTSGTSGKATRSGEERPAGNGSMTDALLAQCDGTTKSPKHIKKEAYSVAARPVFSPPSPEISKYRSYPEPDLPAKSLTCFYWSTQGSCKHSDDACLYAHYDTGSVARPPGSFRSKPKSSYRFGQYEGGADHWSDVNGINIKGSYDGHKEMNGIAAAPTGPKAHSDGYNGSRTYDSWRPN